MANITKRTNKAGEVISYRIRVAAGYDVNGKKRKPHERTWKPSPGMTPRQIEKELNKVVVQFEDECQRGLASVQGSMRLADFCPRYLEIQKSTLSPRVWHDYARIVERLIIPQLGHLRMADIRPAHVQAFISYLQGDVKQRRDGSLDTENSALSPSTVRRQLAVLQSILRQAVKLGIITDNPGDAKKLTLPKAAKQKIEIFTRQEAAEMLKCLEEEDIQFQTLVQLAIITGARAGELVALKFSDFDLETQRLTIERSAYKISGQPIGIKPPKDYEARTVTVNRHCIELVKLLQMEKTKKAALLGTAWHDEGWLFTKDDGTIMHPGTPTKQFPKFLDKHGLKPHRFHSLRHTSATLLLYGGADIKVVQNRLGHSELNTTNKYLHLVEEADVKAAEVLDSLLTIKKIDCTGERKTS